MQRRITPVRGHLPPARTWIVGRTHPLQEHLVRLHAEGQAQGAIAVIRVEPVIARFQRQTGSHTDRLVTCARHLEEDLLLPLEQNFPVINAPGGVHQAVGLDELFSCKSVIKLGLLCAIGHQGQLGVGFCRGHSDWGPYVLDSQPPCADSYPAKKDESVGLYMFMGGWKSVGKWGVVSSVLKSRSAWIRAFWGRLGKVPQHPRRIEHVSY